MANFVRSYTPKQEQQVIKLFTRGLREGEEIVDNKNSTISKETGIKECTVSSIIDNYLDYQLMKLNNRINRV
jgi:hypothetical protein